MSDTYKVGDKVKGRTWTQLDVDLANNTKQMAAKENNVTGLGAKNVSSALDKVKNVNTTTKPIQKKPRPPTKIAKANNTRSRSDKLYDSISDDVKYRNKMKGIFSR